MNQNTSASKHITTLLFGVASISVGLATGCPKDKYYYDATGGKGTPDMTADAQPDLATADCTSANDCPVRDNTEATCTAQGTCEYTCSQGWGDPEGKINAQGCTCDTSTSSCKLEATCGDGFKEGQEQCDNGDQNSDESPDACRTSCKDPSCGDKVQDAGEACDDGNQDNTDACTTQCTPCGNGKLDGGEVCDDGNFTDGDGCSATCQIEDLWACDETTSPSQCWEEWGPPGDPDLIKGFGQSMANTEDVLVIGAPEDSTVKIKQGSVFVYRQVEGKWKMVQRIDPPAEYEADDLRFGHGVALHKNELAIIAAGHNNKLGLVLLFRYDESTQSYKYQFERTIWNGQPGCQLESKLLLDDENLVTTSYCPTDNHRRSIAVYRRFNIYEKFNFTPYEIYDTGYRSKSFAHDLAISNNNLIITTPHVDINSSSSPPKPHGRIFYQSLQSLSQINQMQYIDGSENQAIGAQLGFNDNSIFVKSVSGITEFDQSFKNPKAIISPYSELGEQKSILLTSLSQFRSYKDKIIVLSKYDTINADNTLTPKIFVYIKENGDWKKSNKQYILPTQLKMTPSEAFRGVAATPPIYGQPSEPNVAQNTIFIRAGGKVYPIKL